MSVFGDPEDFECIIDDIGNEISIEHIESSVYNKHGDATDTTGEFPAMKAICQYLSSEDRMVQEGLYRSGDIIFWIKADDVTPDILKFRNKVIFNLAKYEIMEVFQHRHDDYDFVYEVRGKKI
jgi:hypothetical protein